MTQIKHDTPVKRETATEYRGRPLIFEAHAGFLRIWPKGLGRTQAYSIDYAAVFEAAGKMEARRRAADGGKK